MSLEEQPILELSWEHVLHQVGKSVSCKCDLVLTDHQVVVEIPLGKSDIHLNTIVFSDSNIVAISWPTFDVHILVVFWVSNCACSVCHQTQNLRLERIPGCLSYWSCDVVVLGVHHNIPSSVQLAFRIVSWKSESISTRVAGWENTAILVFIVKWLMNVADIVDQKSQRIWFCDVFIAWKETILNVVVNVAVEIVTAIISNA